jgi:hypothetical protein
LRFSEVVAQISCKKSSIEESHAAIQNILSKHRQKEQSNALGITIHFISKTPYVANIAIAWTLEVICAAKTKSKLSEGNIPSSLF